MATINMTRKEFIAAKAKLEVRCLVGKTPRRPTPSHEGIA